MWLNYAIFSAIILAVGSFIITVGTKRNHSIPHMLLGLYLSGAICFGIFIQTQQQWDISYKLLTAGLIIGLGSALGNVLFSKAILQGPASLTGPVSNLNIIFVILMSVLFFEETLNVFQMIAISLLLASSMLLPFDPNESLAIKNKNWYVLMIFTILAMFALNGGLKITQLLGLNNTLVLFYAYCFAFVGFGIHSMCKSEQSFTRISMSIGLLAGLFSFLALQSYAYALESGPASIVVPIFSSRGVLVMLLCLWFFKEKMSHFQKISIACLFSGLFMLG